MTKPATSPVTSPATRTNPLLFGLLAAATAVGAGGRDAAAIEVVPHQAIYDLDLAPGSRSMSVTGVDGQMLFSWGDSCDGWTVEQRYLMRFSYSQGEEVELSSTYTTWESKDGTEFSFSLHSETDGVVDEEIRGSASLDSSGGPGRAEFRMPEETVLPLPRGTLFPTAHTLALYDEAQAGNRLFSATLFDGTEVGGVTEVSAALGSAVPAADSAFPLLDSPAWPVSMAFFPTVPSEDHQVEELEGVPQYQMDVRLHENGVAGDMTIDYGDFAVRATLAKLEPLAGGGC